MKTLDNLYMMKFNFIVSSSSQKNKIKGLQRNIFKLVLNTYRKVIVKPKRIVYFFHNLN